MKTILTAVILLTAAAVSAETAPLPVSPATNSIASTNAPESYKPRRAVSKPDAYTGATPKSKKQKQQTP